MKELVYPIFIVLALIIFIPVNRYKFHLKVQDFFSEKKAHPVKDQDNKTDNEENLFVHGELTDQTNTPKEKVGRFAKQHHVYTRIFDKRHSPPPDLIF